MTFSAGESRELPLVTVVTPFYKSEAYLPETLESFFAQTYPNMEMIIVDDCSPISPASLVPANAKYPIRVIRTPQRSGPGPARNLGIKAARGSMIAFLDSDDLWNPKKIEKQVHIFLTEPNVHWIYTDAYYYQNGKPFPRTQFQFIGLTNGVPRGRELNDYHLRGYNFVTMSCPIFAKRVLEDVGGFNEKLKISEDWDLFTRVAERYPVHVIDEPLTYFRLRKMGHHNAYLSEYFSVATGILTRLYTRQGLLPRDEPKFTEAFGMIYQFLGIQHMNGGQFKDARRAFFHPLMRPKRFELKIIVLRVLTFLPPYVYHVAVWVYSRLGLLDPRSLLKMLKMKLDLSANSQKKLIDVT